MPIFNRIAIYIDFPNDLVHTNHALNLLFGLVLCSFWIVGSAPATWEFEKVIVGVGISSQRNRNEKPAANFLLIVQNDQLNCHETDKYTHKCQVGLLFEEVEGATVHVHAKKYLWCSLTHVEAHVRVVVSVVPLVVVQDLRNPQSTRRQQQDCRVVKEYVLVNEEHDEPEIYAQIKYQQLSF